MKTLDLRKSNLKQLKHVLALTIGTDYPVASKELRGFVKRALEGRDLGDAVITRVGLRPLDTDK